MNKMGHKNTSTLLLGLNLATFTPNSIKDFTCMVIGIYIGGFLPDLDAEYSYIRCKLKLASKLYDLLPKNSWFKHRGRLLHSFWTIIILLTLYHLASNLFILWLAVGIFGHHLADMITPKGLPNYFK